jgi:Co/Zn/Cd efflux system component
VLGINGAMFLAEIVAGLAAGSASLQADALDFLADAGNYGVSLFVIGVALRYRAMAALAKGATMGVVGLAALLANAAVFGLLWAYRGGDANMRSVWLCSRNDVIGNLAVLLAALGVFGTGTGWPDVTVAAVMAVLALQGAWVSIRLASGELREDRATVVAAEQASPGRESLAIRRRRRRPGRAWPGRLRRPSGRARARTRGSRVPALGAAPCRTSP